MYYNSGQGGSAITNISKLIMLIDAEARRFGLLFFGIGLFFVFITPPIANIDESSHLYKIYQVAHFNFVNDPISDQESGGNIPNGLTKLVMSNFIQPEEKYSPSSIAHESSIREDGGSMPVEFTNVAPYPPIVYIPQAIGFRLAGILGRPLLQLYSARIFNLAFLTVMLMIAITLLPFGKQAFMVFCLIPMVIYAGSSLSPDAYVLGVVSVFMAYIMLLYRATRIHLWQWAVLAGLTCLVALGKQTYSVLCLSVVILLLRRHKSRRDMYYVGAIIIITGLITMAWLYCIRHIPVVPVHAQHQLGIESDAHKQVLFILTNPLRFIQAALTGLNIATDGILARFGVGNIVLPVSAYYVVGGLLLLASGSKEEAEHHNLSPSDRKRIGLVLAGVVFLHVIVTLAVLYVTWSNPHDTRVQGVQGRYFLPDLLLLFPVLIGWYTHSIPVRQIIKGAAAMVLMSVVCIATHFY